MFRISVIIPVFNAEKYVEKALLSVLNQKYVEEVLVVDDNSKDCSLEIIKKIQEQFPNKINILEHEFDTNVGAGKARNIGIKAAKNEWLAFLDVDDYYYSSRFENAVEVISENADADGVYEAVENVFLNEKVKKKFIDSRPERYQTETLKPIQTFFTLDQKVAPNHLFKELMKGEIGFFHFNGVLLKKSLFEKVGYLNEELKLTQDTDVFNKMAIMGNLYPGNIHKPVAARLIHENNRVYNDELKLNYYQLLNFYKLKKWAEKMNVSKQNKQIIDLQNVKLCASLILQTDLYKNYRLKSFLIHHFNQILIPFYLFRLKKKLKI